MKKLLDLSDECVKSLSKKAIDENTNFKLFAQKILETESIKIRKAKNKLNKQD